MGQSDLTFSSDQGTTFIQPDGPGTPLYWLGNCYDADDIEAPAGEITIRQCRNANREYEVVGQAKAPPEPVTTTMTGLSKKTRDWLQKLKCDGLAALYFMQSSCGQQDNPTGFDVATVLQKINITSRTLSNVAMRGEPGETTNAMAIQAWPPLIQAYGVSVGRVTTTEAQALNDIWADKTGECGDCGTPRDPGDLAGIAADSAAGPATANILFSTNGLTFAAGAADPFGAGLHAISIASFPVNKTGRRWLLGEQGVVATQGHVAYSDDAGATWTVINVGGAAAGHGAVYGKCIYAPNSNFCHLATRVGYIYKSIDGGATWTATESGVITAGNYSGIHFADDKYGAAVAAAGVVATTVDGGETWDAGTVINAGAAGNLTVHVFDDKRIQVGDDAGKLWQSTDFGATWTQITGWTGSGAGDVRSIDYCNDFVGFMAHNTVAPLGSVLRTVDGGTNWTLLDDIPTNSGLNSIVAVDENTAWVVGEANGGTGVILKVTEN
jgi:photosystem II stability/assembly factor-like uncharacterized protein